MNAWIILFILICIFYGPAYIATILIGRFLTSFDGKFTFLDSAKLLFLSILLGMPIILSGYMAYTHMNSN